MLLPRSFFFLYSSTSLQYYNANKAVTMTSLITNPYITLLHSLSHLQESKGLVIKSVVIMLNLLFSGLKMQ